MSRSWRYAAALLVVEIICAILLVGRSHAADPDGAHAGPPVLNVWAAGDGAVFVQSARYASAVVEAHARETAARKAPAPRAPRSSSRPSVAVYGSGACGGTLPPCWVYHREDPTGDLTVWNGGCHEPVGWTGPPCGRSTASGKWQFLRSTWNGYAGYVNAADAPESVQDAKARLVWAGGAGCGHWSACS